MSGIEAFLTSLEAKLRFLVEGDARRDGFPKKLHQKLERELVRAMRAVAQQGDGVAGRAGPGSNAPGEYTLLLPAIEAQMLLTHPGELDRLTQRMEEAAARARISFAQPLVLHVVADPQAADVTIQASFSQASEGSSSTFQLEEDLKNKLENGSVLPAAFLIVNGLSTFAIRLPIVNLGRDPTNQLQLIDPHISPKHAQIRYVQGRFVIFDLDSHAGTFVNGVAVSSRALNPGDVIQLGGLPLVYGQEQPSQAGQTQELPAEPPPPEVL